MRRGEDYSGTRGPISPSHRSRPVNGNEICEETVPIVDATCQTTREQGAAVVKSNNARCGAESRDACTPSADSYLRHRDDEREEEDRLPLHEQRCRDEECETRDEERSETNIDNRHSQSYLEEREGALIDSDFHDQRECELQLLLFDEEEENMRREWEETNREYEEGEALAVLDQLLQIHEEEYPEHHRAGETMPETTRQNFVEIDEEHESDGLDRLLLPMNDSQMEELVTSCDRHDQEYQTSVVTTANPRPWGRNTSHSACVICLEAPRTHAYVPCGHFCVCFSCAKNQTQQPISLAAASSCPVCQQPCTRIMRIFVP